MKTRQTSFRVSISFSVFASVLAAFLLSGVMAKAIPGFPGIPGGLPFFFLSSDPVNGATGVSTTKAVTFAFSADPAADSKVVWSANVNPADVTYSVGKDALTQMPSLVCKPKTAWPSGEITWDISALQGADGSELIVTGPANGKFTTSSGGGGGGTPCDPGTSAPRAGVTFSKSLNYAQSGTTAPVLVGNEGATFVASASSGAGTTLNSVSLTTPAGAVNDLTGIFGNFFLADSFATEAALDAAYPNGSYTVKAQLSSGAVQYPLNLTSGGIPVPQVSNLAQLQSANAGSEVLVQFNGIPTPSASDFISFSVSSQGNSIFILPNLCLNLDLPNTAKSLTIPKGILSAGTKYVATLSYFHESDANNSTAALPGVASFMRMTTFAIVTAGGGGVTAAPAKFVSYSRLPDGSFQLKISGTAGATYTIQSSADLVTWSGISTQQASASGEISFTDAQAKSAVKTFYRVRSGQ